MGEGSIANYIALTALVLSFISLAWTIISRRSYILPRSRTQLNRDTLHNGESVPEKQSLEILNRGPTDLIVRFPILATKKPNMWSKKYSFWDISNICGQPFGGKQIGGSSPWPRLLKPGEICHLELLDLVQSVELPIQPVGVGFLDTFDRFHLIPNLGFNSVLGGGRNAK